MKVKTAAESIVTIVAASLGLILLNALVCGARARMDLTEQHIFTLSPASTRIVKTLPEKMVVKAYFGGIPASTPTASSTWRTSSASTPTPRAAR